MRMGLQEWIPGLCGVLVLAAGLQAAEFDWPQWQGKDRTAISKETGLLKRWPKEGPPLLWKATKLGGGYSTPSVAEGRIFGMSFRGEYEVVWALNEADGKELWSTRIARANKGIGYGDGSRCSPTVDGKLLYALGVSGDLACLDVASGKIEWTRNLAKQLSGKMMSGWGYSESPLIDGNKVVVTPGGRNATLAALDKKTGKDIWRGPVPQGDGAGYSSIIVAEVEKQRQYVQFLGGGVVGMDAQTGRFLWRYDHPHNGTANCSTPLYADGKVFAASGYGTGGGLAKLSRAGKNWSAEEVYFTKNMKNHHGGMVLLDGCIYGSDEGEFTCLDFETGKLLWESRRPGKGSIAAADGCLYYRNENGPMHLIEATAKDYVELGRFTPPDRSDRSAWSHPVIANGRLYLLDQDVLLCYDVKQK